MYKINIPQAIADLEQRKDIETIEVIEYKLNMNYMYNKVEILEAVEPVRGEPSEGYGCTRVV